MDTNFSNFISNIKDALVEYNTTFLDLFGNVSYQIYIYKETDDVVEGVILVFSYNEDEISMLSNYIVDEDDVVIPRLIIVFSKNKLIINNTQDINEVFEITDDEITDTFKKGFITLIGDLSPKNINKFFQKYVKYKKKR